MAETSICKHCDRPIVKEDGVWADPKAPRTPEEGDDYIWRETCDAHDTFIAEHEPTTRLVDVYVNRCEQLLYRLAVPADADYADLRDLASEEITDDTPITGRVPTQWSISTILEAGNG